MSNGLSLGSRHSTSQSSLLLLLVTDLNGSIELAVVTSLRGLETSILGTAHNPGIGVATLDVIPAVDESNNASNEDQDEADTPNDLTSGARRVLVKNSNTEGKGEEERHNDIQEKMNLIEISANNEGNDGIDDEDSHNGEDLSVDILVLLVRVGSDETKQESDGKLLDQDNKVEASLLVVVDSIEGTETELQEKEDELLALTPDDNSVKDNRQDTKDQDNSDGSSDGSVVRTRTLTNMPSSSEVERDHTEQDNASQNVEDLLDEKSLNEGLLLAEEEPHEEGIDDINEQNGASKHGEPEHSSVEDVLSINLDRVGILLSVKETTRDEATRSRGRSSNVGRETTRVEGSIVLISIRQGEHEVGPVEVTRELDHLSGEGDVDERVVRNELEQVIHLPGLSRALITQVSLLKEVSREKSGSSQDRGSDVVDRSGREDADGKHKEEDHNDNNGSNQQTNLIPTSSIPGTAAAEVRTIEVTSDTLLSIRAPTASAELGDTRSLSGEGITSSVGSDRAVSTSPESIAAANEVGGARALSVTVASVGALTGRAVRLERVVTIANANSRKRAVTATERGSAIRFTFDTRAISTMTTGDTLANTSNASTSGGTQRLTAVLRASRRHADSPDGIGTKGKQMTVLVGRGGVSIVKRSRTKDRTSRKSERRSRSGHGIEVDASDSGSLEDHNGLTSRLINVESVGISSINNGSVVLDDEGNVESPERTLALGRRRSLQIGGSNDLISERLVVDNSTSSIQGSPVLNSEQEGL